MVGEQFVKWTVIEATPYIDRFGYKPYWVCRCECGTERKVLQRNLLAGKSRGCGHCGYIPSSVKNKYPREYRAWQDMRTRCNNPNFIGYAMYGGRGITIDKKWEKFESFLSDMGRCPKGYWLDRCDNNRGYAPDNCRWTTPKEQARNTRRNVYLTLNGETHTVAEWSEKTGINQYTLHDRIKHGLSDEECLRKPIRQSKRLIAFHGETLPLADWASRLGLGVEALRTRLQRWPLEKALTMPTLQGKQYLNLPQNKSS